MTICNMAIEAGAPCLVWLPLMTLRSNYVQKRPYAPEGEQWEAAVAWWQTLVSDPDAEFDHVVVLHGEAIEPQVSWGTSPEMVAPVSGLVPDPDKEKDDSRGREYSSCTCLHGGFRLV